MSCGGRRGALILGRRDASARAGPAVATMLIGVKVGPRHERDIVSCDRERDLDTALHAPFGLANKPQNHMRDPPLDALGPFPAEGTDWPRDNGAAPIPSTKRRSRQICPMARCLATLAIGTRDSRTALRVPAKRNDQHVAMPKIRMIERGNGRHLVIHAPVIH